MDYLNYHHLRYFWAVAQEGSLRQAAAKMRVAQPTISAQLASLETTLGQKLFRRSPRGLTLTETGQHVFSYARDIFALGQEMFQSVKHQVSTRPLRLHVGIADSLPKLVSHEILKPIFALPQPIQATCTEGKPADLLAQLALYRLDIVLANEPASSSLHLKAFNHRLGECGVSFCAAPALARKLCHRFPRALDQAPVLLPTASPLRRSLEDWFQTHRLYPRLVAEYDDAALMKAAAADGLGFFAAPTVAAAEAVERYGFEIIGVAAGVREQFYAVTAERRLSHPAVQAITSAARRELFGSRRKT